MQVLKTEVTRHVFDGGKLNFEGTEVASPKVLAEGKSCQSFRKLLGQEETYPPVIGLFDRMKISF